MHPKMRLRMACGSAAASHTPKKLPPMPVISSKGNACHKSGVRNRCMARAVPEEKIKKTRLMPCAVICGTCSTTVSHVTSKPALPTPSPERSATKKVTAK